MRVFHVRVITSIGLEDLAEILARIPASFGESQNELLWQVVTVPDVFELGLVFCTPEIPARTKVNGFDFARR